MANGGNPNVKVLFINDYHYYYVVMLLARVVSVKHFRSVECSALNVRVLYSQSKNQSKNIHLEIP